MELGQGVDRGRLLPPDDTDSDDAPSIWERWLLGRTRGRAPHLDAIRAARINLACEVLAAMALLWTLCTERPQWRDAWDVVDALLALPTLIALLCYHADPPPNLARWCYVLVVAYTLGVAFDVVWLLMGRWRAVASRTVTALADGGSLLLWVQCVYYNRLLARELARQQQPIAYVTVSSASGDVVEAAALPVAI